VKVLKILFGLGSGSGTISGNSQNFRFPILKRNGMNFLLNIQLLIKVKDNFYAKKILSREETGGRFCWFEGVAVGWDGGVGAGLGVGT
jgi:hypothetical protein